MRAKAKCPFEKRLQRIGARIIREELLRCNGDRKLVAERLGMTRTTLWRFMHEVKEQEDDETDAALSAHMASLPVIPREASTKAESGGKRELACTVSARRE